MNAAAGRPYSRGLLQAAVFFFEPTQVVESVLAGCVGFVVGVHRGYAGARAASHRNPGSGKLAPPISDLAPVRGCFYLPLLDVRGLVQLYWMDAPAQPSIEQRRVY